MANFKSEIAEALYDSSVNVSKEALVWAMSNLPDNKNHGSYTSTPVKREYNHNTENVWDAVGMSRERLNELSVIMAKQLNKITEPNATLSSVVEGVMDATIENPDLVLVIAVKTVQDALEHASEAGEMAKMMKMIKLMDRFKKKNDDEEI